MNRRLQKLTALVLAVLMAITAAPVARAQENDGSRAVTRAVVWVEYDSYLNVRSGPGVNYSISGRLNPDEWVTVLRMEMDSEGVAWYQILSDNGVSGYVHSEYIHIEGDEGVMEPEDMSFEALLDQQGFPQSYRPQLRSLHEKFPNWVFTAQHTGLDWNTLVEEESVLGRNLVYYTVADSWKSYEEGAYNPVSRSWKGYDGEAWICASPEVIAYFLDPRNFLDHTGIFQFETLSYNKESHRIEGVENIIQDSFMENESFKAYDGKTYTFAEAFINAAEQSDVSPFYLASRVLMEQGLTGSAVSSGNYKGFEGIYNYFNIGAYTANGYDAIHNGLTYASQSGSYHRPWNDQLKSILGGAEFLVEDYIQYGQDTMYLYKFDVVDGGNGYYFHQYMTNVQAPSAEAVSYKAAYTDSMMDNTLTFKIPVYENMPEQAVARPMLGNNGNQLLDSIAVDGEPARGFNAYTEDYYITLDPSVTTVEITAQTNDAGAAVAGTGTVEVSAEAWSELGITVTASNGRTKEYTIHVSRKEGGDGILSSGEEDPEEPKEDISQYPVIYQGSSETEYVRKLQNRLNELGYDCGAADGLFGYGTYEAVVRFQTDHDLEADGYVGQNTWKALYEENTQPPEPEEPEPEPEPEPDPEVPEVDVSGYPVISWGSAQGEYVKKLQNRLNELGYDCGAADGLFGSGTHNAVVKFQKDHDLEADGYVGANTWKALFNGTTPPSEPEEPEPEPDPEPEVPGVDVSGYPVISWGSAQGEYVRKLQNRLNELGYNCGTADGLFGSGTHNAVVKFQKDHGLEADGYVGQNTWKALFNGTTPPSEPEEPEPEPGDPEVDVSGYPVISQGSAQGEYVKKLQEWLNKLGYDCGNVDGLFGSGTHNAVLRFQRDQGLTADGYVGANTWKALVQNI